jgi:hypothetical protein
MESFQMAAVTSANAAAEHTMVAAPSVRSTHEARSVAATPEAPVVLAAAEGEAGEDYAEIRAT